MDKRRVLARKIAKYTLFAFVLMLLYVLQSIPGFLKIFGVKPVFVIPFCVALSILDDKWPAGAIFILGGLLTDLSANRIVGFFTLQIIIYCSACIVAVKFFFRATKRNAFFISFVVMFVMLTFDYIITYALHGYSHGLFFYIRSVILISVYSSAFCPLFYKLIDEINYSRFMRVETR